MIGRGRYRSILALLMAMALFYARSGQFVWADAAPPERPPGSSVEPGEDVTQVQMVSEEVLLVIIGRDVPAGDRGDLAANLMTGHVEAVFVMRNQGEAEESFDVWFPLGVPDGYGDVTQVEDFRARVDNVPAHIIVGPVIGYSQTRSPEVGFSARR